MKTYRNGFIILALSGLIGAQASECINLNKDWTFAFNSNTQEFSPLGLDSSRWKVTGSLPSDPKWGSPARLFNQCPTEGWLSGPGFKFPASIDVDMGREESFCGMRIHFFGNAPNDYELYAGNDLTASPDVTVTASSEETRNGNRASNVLDGDRNTRWCAQGGKTGEWLMLDFGRSQPLSSLSITWEKEDAYQYKLETSVDKTVWTLAADRQNAGEARQTTSDRIDAAARYVKITVTGLPKNAWASVREITFPEKPVSGAPVVRGTFSPAAVQLITFPPQTVRQLRLRLLSGENPKSCQIGELELLDAAGVEKAKQLMAKPQPVIDFSKAADCDYDDSAWRKLSLPHDWSIECAFNSGSPAGRNSGYLSGGLGFYRKTLFVPAEWADKKVTVKFGGIYMNSSIYCNGKYAGGRNYGYSTYVVDLTPHLKSGQSNVIAVRVDNRNQPNSRWYTGSGIYRDVTLQVAEKVHVAQWGVFVTTPEIKASSAQVKIQTRIMNETDSEQACVLTTEIYAPDGRKIAEVKDSDVMKAASERNIEQMVAVQQPALWSPSAPALYKAVSLVKSGSGKTDRVETVFGIRTAEFGSEFGFKLNGEKLIIKGFCLHHDLGAVGAADFPRALERRLQELKKMGVNAIRTSHDPYSERFMQLCDEMGFMVLGEMYDKWNFGNVFIDPDGSRIEWKETWPRDLAEFVLRDRNHPSVIMWSVGNEVAEQVRDKNVEGTGPNDGGISVFNALKSCVNAVDGTRPVSVGLFPKLEPGDEPPKMALAADVIGTNYLEKYWKEWHRKYPGMIFYASEITTRDWGAAWFDWDKTYAAGQFYWGGTDYLGEGRGWPDIGWYRGLVDLTGFIKDGAYYVKSFYNEEPMVRIAVQDEAAGSETVVWNAVKLTKDERRSHWNWQGMTNVTVYTCSNCEEIELFLNGRSLGVKKLKEAEKQLPVWSVPFEPGSLKAVARNHGAVVAEHEIKTAGKAVRLVLQPERDSIGADGDLGYINVLVTDAAGTVVPDANQTVRFEVTGAGENYAVANADMLCAEPFRGDRRPAYHGKAQLIVRALRPGAINVKATAGGLTPGKLTIQAK
ncbi:MAG: discoidin domain-containing protein [Kiritimatiellales bacterium]|jgi:beta-galactosidase